MKIAQIATPALTLEAGALEGNIRRMQAICDRAGVSLRPHYKSHRCWEIARMQLDAGAKGMTCAKVGEAEDLVNRGAQDVLIANQVVTDAALTRLAGLAKRARMAVCVDCLENVRRLSRVMEDAGASVSVLAEFEVGMRRCGVATFDEARALASEIMRLPGLRFGGIQAYAGHLSHECDEPKRTQDSLAIERSLARLKVFLEEQGIPVSQISGMSTGTTPLRARMKTVYTEAQAGSYPLMDASYGRMDLPFANALFVLSTVVSARPDAFFTDAGLKTCSTDQGAPLLAEHPEWPAKLSEEHISHFAPEHPYAPGDIVRYIPGHCCTNMNLFDAVWLVDGDDVLRSMAITARGRSQ